MHPLLQVVGLLALIISPVSSLAQDSFPIDSIIHLRKNTNNNQVHYAVNVDQQCRPESRRTVRAYWKMLEEGPDVTEGLQLWERPGYGVRQPENVTRHKNGGEFVFQIRGVEDQPIKVEVFKSDAECRARAVLDARSGAANRRHRRFPPPVAY